MLGAPSAPFVTQTIFEAYRDGGARDFFPDHFADEEARAGAVRRAARPLDARVAAAVEAQNARLAASSARERNLRLLRDGAAAVVTGQQVGLFLGPLYNLYKAATAIAVAGELSRSQGTPVVPVFWLQTEDHDLPEIAVCRVPRSGRDPLCLELPASAEQRVSLAHLDLPDAVGGLLDEVTGELGNLPLAAPHLERLRRHYQPGRRWSEAFAGMLAELFADHGLVLIDPRDDALGDTAAAVHRRAIDAAEPISQALLARCGEIEARGWSAAAHVRPGAPLSFYHPRDRDGPRYRLEVDGDRWREVGGSDCHDAADVARALGEDPLCCSTSVLLRPILQDTLLPTAAYVGGPGEIAYFAQLAPLYEAFEMKMPLIVPRASMRLLEQRTLRWLDALNAEPGQAANGVEALLSGSTTAQASLDADAIETDILAAYDDAIARHRDRLEGAGDGMTQAIERTARSVRHAVAKLVAKYGKAKLHQSEDLVAAAGELERWLFPAGIPQERYYGLSYFAARYGERELIDRVVSAVVPYSTEIVDLLCEDAAR